MAMAATAAAASTTSSSVAREQFSNSFSHLSSLRSRVSFPASTRTLQLRTRKRAARIGATAAGSSSSRSSDEFAEEAKRKLGRAARVVVDKAETLFNDVKHKAQEFEEDNDLQGKARRFAGTANQKIEELGFELKSNAVKLNRKYRFTDKGQEFVDYVKDQVQAADSRFSIRQRARTLRLDVRMKWPSYRRQIAVFLETPLGRLLSTMFFVWFVLSGWIFRLFVLSMWVLPIAAPLLLTTIARNAIVEGSCPNCKAQFFGSRSQVVVCRSCRNVVWQPRDDFSSREDPSIIDIDVDKD